jgi:RNA polymerase sigma-70 factor (ECF subfamily)
MLPPMANDEDILSIGEILKGNHHAFAAIVRRYQKQLYAHIHRLIRRHEDVDDVLQETFVRAYQHLAEFDTARPLYPWLRRIAFNLAISHLRAVGRLQPLDDLPEDFLKEFLDPQRELENSELHHAINRAIAGLPDDQQSIVTLQFRGGLSYQEISAQLHIPLGTVMSRLARAKEKLRAELSVFHTSREAGEV